MVVVQWRMASCDISTVCDSSDGHQRNRNIYEHHFLATALVLPHRG